MHRVAAEITKEILVLFQYRNLDTLTRQKVSEHYASGPTTHHTASRFQNLKRHIWMASCLKTAQVLRC